MNRLDDLVRVGRQDGYRVDLVAVVGVGLPDPGEGERLIVRPLDPVRLFGTGLSLPLVEAVSDHETPAVRERVLEHRLLGDGLAPGVDRRPTRVRLVPPVRAEAPVVAVEVLGVVVRNDDEIVTGGDIVPGLDRLDGLARTRGYLELQKGNITRQYSEADTNVLEG